MLLADFRKIQFLTFIVVSINIFLYVYYYTKISTDHHESHFPVKVDNDEKLSKALLNAKAQHTILMWYPMFGLRRPVTIDRESCGNCMVSYDRSVADEESTKAIIFHYNEAYLDDMPKTRYNKNNIARLRHNTASNKLTVNTRRTDQLYIWWSLESTRALRVLRNMELKEFDNFFNLSMSYRRDSDVYHPYGTSADVLQAIQDKGGNSTMAINNLIINKTMLAVWIVSNCQSTKGARQRMEFSQELVDAGLDLNRGGNCFPKADKILESNEAEVIKNYKFYMAFENNMHCLDYITEKVFQSSFRLGVVPVVFGARKKDYEAIVPPRSCIFVEDFDNPKKLVEYLQYLDKNDTAYKEYLQWRTMKVEEMSNYKRANGFCQLCRILHGINVDNLYNPYYNQSYSWIPMYGAPKTPRVVPSLRDWFYGRENKECLEAF